MTESRRTYLPAAGHHLFLPLYDPLVKLLGGDRARRVLIDQAALQPGHRVLDVGCGTGTLAVLLKRLHPGVEVIGIDPDPRALARAKRKAERAALSIRFDRGFSNELPYPDATFDRVFSSLMFHHLEAEEKEKSLREIRRVLRPDGALHLLDFGGSNSHSDAFLARLFHSSGRLKDNFDSRIPAFMSRAGFRDVGEVGRGTLLIGPIAYYRASA
jgi:ubiquinone/menaquinone biosynthesis C-methylase UbiE